MPETPTAATFRPHLGDTFTIRFTDGSVDLRLAEVPERSGYGTPGRTPFALYFLGPGETVLPQRIYAFEHAVLGFFSLFIVPLGPTGEGMRYEAVFN